MCKKSSTDPGSKNYISLIFCLFTVHSLSGVEAFLIQNPQNVPTTSFCVNSSLLTSNKLINGIVPRQRSIATTDMRRMATVERGSTEGQSSRDGKSKKMGMDNQKVLFQKVIRPTPNMPDVLFLGYLIEYLERHFELPSDLPMVYENMVIDHDGGGSSDDRYTLAWDSPLSPSADATRMEVEVVGIYTDDNNKPKEKSAAPSLPNMAMVVVRRPNNSISENNKATSLPPMMKGLFDDCETRILRALDRGLDDFVAGKIKFELNDDIAEDRTRGEIPPPPPNFKTAEEVIDAELVDGYSATKGDPNKVAPEDVVFDAYATTDTRDDNESDNNLAKKNARSKEDIADAKARAIATMQKPAIETSQKDSEKDSTTVVDFAVKAAAQRSARQNKEATKKKDNPNTNSSSKKSATKTIDFAVAAAQKAASLRKKQKQSTSSSSTKIDEDFAVAAARKMAASSSTTPKINRENKRNVDKESGRKSVRGVSKEPQVSEGPSMPPIPDGWKPRDYFKDQRAFSGTISSPKTGIAKTVTKRMANSFSVKSSETKSPPKRPSVESAKIVSRSTDTVSSSSSRSKSASTVPEAETKAEIQKRKVNARIVDKSSDDNDDDDNASIVDPLLEQAAKTDGDIPSRKEIELEIAKAAKTALDEIEKEGREMTPEEMLRDVLKFDKEQKKEETPGSGFVSGAFEKAKELMKDRHRQIQDRKKQEQQQQQEVQFKEMERPDPSSFPKYPNPVEIDSGETSKREMTPEEELRQMFAAGQKIAEGKITTKGSSSLKTMGTTEEDVDRLIAEEKTVSKYARILDDELAELEVRINSSPGEELDGPPKNPIFDVMSGPEVYDRNVELDAVNYPGALPGTADVKLPKQLHEAIKQAQFAASVLMQLDVEEITDEITGETTERFFSGKKELTAQQLENLNKVVDGAIQSGIIDDPVEVMAEASRLQLVLDELWDQPEERFYEIASNYQDLLLSDRLVGLIRQRLSSMADRDLDALRRDDESLREPHEKERNILGRLVSYAQALLKETRALGAELEAQQLEVVRSICKVAMDPEHTTEEETSMALSDAVRDMRPLLDDAFVAYLKYAVAEEEARLARAGLVDDPDYNQWLFVLKIVQQGVYAEIAKGINRYIEHIWYVLRMETPRQRRQLLSDLIDDMPTMDVRPFVQVVDNIVGSLGDGVTGNFDGLVPLGEMTNSLLQLQNDVKELLPPERIAEKSKVADEWAAKQKKRLLEQRQIGRQRLEAAKEAAQREEDIGIAFGEGGEVDRFD